MPLTITACLPMPLTVTACQLMHLAACRAAKDAGVDEPNAQTGQRLRR